MSAPVPDPVDGPGALPAAPEPDGATPHRGPRRFERLGDRSTDSPGGPGSVPEPVKGTIRSTRPHSSLPLVLLAVFAAGMLGTAARLAVDGLLPADPTAFPLSTLLINTLGSFALGLVVAALPHTAPEWLRAAVTTGLLGSFTTFSAITVAAVAISRPGGLLDAGILLAVSVVAGLAAAVAGIALGGAIGRRPA